MVFTHNCFQAKCGFHQNCHCIYQSNNCNISSIIFILEKSCSRLTQLNQTPNVKRQSRCPKHDIVTLWVVTVWMLKLTDWCQLIQKFWFNRRLDFGQIVSSGKIAWAWHPKKIWQEEEMAKRWLWYILCHGAIFALISDAGLKWWHKISPSKCK